ncbi:hypothetical protein [Georgenia sp. SUBG003]
MFSNGLQPSHFVILFLVVLPLVLVVVGIARTGCSATSEGRP